MKVFKPRSTSGAPTLRNMPAWLMFAPWIVVLCSLLLAVLVLVLDFRGGHKESKIVTRIFQERGSSLIHAFEATLQAGMGFQWTDEELQGVLDTLATSPDIHYMAVTDQNGHVLAANLEALVGTTMASPEMMRTLMPCRQAEGRMVSFSLPGKGPVLVFQVYQQISVRQYGERLRRHGHMMRGHRGRSGAAENQDLVLFVGYDLTPLLAAQKADANQAFVHWTVLAFIAAVGVLTLFLVKGYQRSRLMVQETTAFTYALIDTLPLGIIGVDAGGRITTFNPEAARITGQNGLAAMGHDLAKTLPGLWTVLTDAGLLASPEIKSELETRCVFGDQRRIPLALTASAIITEEGRLAGHTLVLRDLGEIRRLQAEIRRQDRLAALGNMAAGIAHEIRNPLGAIKGLARFFRESHPEGSQEARMADIMTQEVQRLDNVVGDLLELARPDTLSLSPTSPNALLDRVRHLAQSDMDAHGIQYSQETDTDIPDMPLDNDRMTQVLLNLYLNAIQAMPHGGELHVTARLLGPHALQYEDAHEVLHTDKLGHAIDVDSGAWLLLEIRDTGTGIPKDRLQEIFSPYYTTKARGTGLGLSLVHKIVEAHDGEIEVRSQEGQGSVFTLRLPIPVKMNT